MSSNAGRELSAIMCGNLRMIRTFATNYTFPFILRPILSSVTKKKSSSDECHSVVLSRHVFIKYAGMKTGTNLETGTSAEARCVRPQAETTFRTQLFEFSKRNSGKTRKIFMPEYVFILLANRIHLFLNIIGFWFEINF